MQILYGNDGVNYRLIDKSMDMSDGVQKSMLSTYSKYEFVTNFKAYSSIEREPEAITYVSSNLDNQMPSDQLVVCKTGRMSQFSSPSYYFHGIVKEVSEEFYKKDFFEIFSYNFVKDIDAIRYENAEIDKYAYLGNQTYFSPLTNEQLVVILASFMANEKRGVKTKIIVDVSGDTYNFRSREILYCVYRYLPYELRKRYGFKSYTQDERNIPARISFVLFNKDETSDNGDFITLNESIYDIEKKVDEQYVKYARYLVEELDDCERERHFEKLSGLAKNGRLKIDECLTFYNNMNKWAVGTQEELLPEWIQYVDQNSFRKGPLYEALLEIIVQRVDNNYYNDYLFDNVLKLYNENISNLSPTAARTLRFADCLEEIYIDPERFSQWYRSTLQAKMERFDKNESGYIVQIEKLYEAEIASLQATDIMSVEFAELVNKEIQYLEGEKSALLGDIDQQVAREKEDIMLKLGALSDISFEAFAPSVRNIWESIRFEENKTVTVEVVEKWLDVMSKRKLSSEREWHVYHQIFDELKNIISSQKYEEISERMENERTKFEIEKKTKVIALNREHILDGYNSLMEAIRLGVLELSDIITIRTMQHDWQPNVQIVKLILEFALCPEQKYIEAFSKFIPDLLKIFLGTDILMAEHLECLIGMPSMNSDTVIKVLDYYLIKSHPVVVSGIYIAKLLKEYQPEMIQMVVENYEDRDGEAAIMVEELQRMSKTSHERKKGIKDFLGGKKES